jgi:DNA modification methylase
LNIGDSYANNTSAGTSDGSSSTIGTNRDGSPGNKAWSIIHGAKRIAPGYKAKDLMGMPWQVAFALRADGWWLRSDIIWHKPNAMPSSVTDRPSMCHEYLFLLAKSDTYFYDGDAIKEPISASMQAAIDRGARKVEDVKYESEDVVQHKVRNPVHVFSDPESLARIQMGRNSRTVWSIPTSGFSGDHFAPMTRLLAEKCVMAGSAMGDAVFDPFGGSGTTAMVALAKGRKAVVTELNPKFARMSVDRINSEAQTLPGEEAVKLISGDATKEDLAFLPRSMVLFG